MKRSLFILAASILISIDADAIEPSQLAFFDSLSSLCQQRFEGEMTYPEEGLNSFKGKTLLAKFIHCEDSQIRVSFEVGDDKARTWLITKTKKGLELKHDHRHKDGTEYDINMYGGLAKKGGTALSQSFAANKATANAIPAAKTNVWTLSLSDDMQNLRYYLERHAEPRFNAEFVRMIDKD